MTIRCQRDMSVPRPGSASLSAGSTVEAHAGSAALLRRGTGPGPPRPRGGPPGRSSPAATAGAAPCAGSAPPWPPTAPDPPHPAAAPPPAPAPTPRPASRGDVPGPRGGSARFSPIRPTSSSTCGRPVTRRANGYVAQQLVAAHRHRRRDRPGHHHRGAVRARPPGSSSDRRRCGPRPRRPPCPSVAAAITRLRIRKRCRSGSAPGGHSLISRPVSAICSNSAALPTGYGRSTPQASTATVSPSAASAARCAAASMPNAPPDTTVHSRSARPYARSVVTCTP